MFGTTAGPTWAFTIGVNAPSNLAVSIYASNSVTLTWTDNSTNEQQFRIEQDRCWWHFCPGRNDQHQCRHFHRQRRERAAAEH